MSGRAVSRLKLLSRHFEPLSEPNTPFAIERASSVTADIPSLSGHARYYSSIRSVATENSTKMSSQESHPALLIPGPIEFDDAVLQSMSHFRCALLFQLSLWC